MAETQTPDWTEAERYLYEVKSNYEAIGAAGHVGLMIAVLPCVGRFERGERTEELHESIMNLR